VSVEADRTSAGRLFQSRGPVVRMYTYTYLFIHNRSLTSLLTQRFHRHSTRNSRGPVPRDPESASVVTYGCKADAQRYGYVLYVLGVTDASELARHSPRFLSCTATTMSSRRILCAGLPIDFQRTLWATASDRKTCKRCSYDDIHDAK